MSPALPSTPVTTVSRPGLGYHEPPPFDPPNPVYEAVEALFRSLGLDAARAGSPAWNPLGDVIEPGNQVAIKPNLVASKNLHERIEGAELSASSTHGSVLRPILDYALRAAGPRGQVTVVDCPVEGCEIERVAQPLGIYRVVDHLRGQGHPVRFLDLRTFRVAPHFALDDVQRLGRSLNLGLLIRTPLSGDPRGYRVIDVGRDSFFSLADAPSLAGLRFHRSHYRTPLPHHTEQRHEYSFGQTVLDADVIINLPKLKTHKKTGVTLSLKSVIGLTSEKYWLPHFSAGDPSMGGDEFDRPQTWADQLEHRLSRLPLPGDHSLVARAPRIGRPPAVADGSWEGNDTLWRTILDLNRVLLYASKDGRMQAEPQRRCLSIVDGILAGEGEGPLGATPVASGLLIGGFDPCLVDWVATRTMGLDPEQIPTIARALSARLLRTSDLQGLEQRQDGPEPTRRFVPPRSWPRLLGALPPHGPSRGDE
ncbi:MAG: hypothetical protein DRI90_00150 [Deltaproteobacteria bacterium]|nr:MAG: hypothetical protein DRI90_00150 [Deltaproteobacteria bacterium]